MPTLSVIIPTRERAEYLGAAISSAISIKSDKIEILVSDNVSADHTLDVVNAVSDPRLRYVNPGRRMSMRQHYEFAVSQARGDYFLMIGDDDAVIPGAIPGLIEMLEERKPKLVWWSPPLYEWPSFGPERKPHLLITSNMLFGGYGVKSTAPLATALCNGTLKTQRAMPSIYHGCASRVLMDEIKQRGGHYFGAQNPDCFVSFAGCLLADSFIQMRHPASIAGASPKSNAGSMQSQQVFIQEAESDAVTDPLDIGSLAVAVLYLSTLVAARRVLPTAPAINWEEWLGRAVHEIHAMYPEKEVRNGYLDRLAKSVAAYGQVLPPGPEGETITRKKLKKRHGRLPSLGRMRIAFGPASTVMDAVDFIEKISGSYSIHGGRPLNRHIRWLGALLGNNSKLGAESSRPS